MDRGKLLLVGVQAVQLGCWQAPASPSHRGRGRSGRPPPSPGCRPPPRRSRRASVNGLRMPRTLRIGPGRTPMPTRSSLSSPESISCGMPASKTLPCSSRLSISRGARRGLKAGHAGLVECSRSHPGHVDLAGTDVGDGARLVLRLPGPRVLHECDLQRALRQLIDLVRPGLDLGSGLRGDRERQLLTSTSA